MNHHNKKFFIFSGEHSGDVHGARLAKSLKKLDPYLILEGVTGSLMREENIKSLLHMENFLVMGFTDVLREFPNLYKNFRIIRKHILETNPDAVILIDYQEFNYLLSKSLRKHGYTGKIIQYISPSVWAWRPKRADQLAKHLDLLLTIYPFESEYYSHTSLDVHYIGNPIKEKIDTYSYSLTWKEDFGIPNKPIIGIFPGSRISEIKNNLPLFLQAANLFDNGDYYFGISCTDSKSEIKIKELLEIYANRIKNKLIIIPRKYTYELMKESTFALAKSGTVTLELAIHQIPTVVAYQISKFHKFLCKNILKINLPFFCITNILAKKAVFPEFIDQNICARALLKEMKRFIDDKPHYIRTQKHCEEVNTLLTASHPSDLAAKIILETLA